MGPQELWEYEQIFQGYLGTNWILDSGEQFGISLLGEHSKSFLGIREILGIFLRNTGIQIPIGDLDTLPR